MRSRSLGCALLATSTLLALASTTPADAARERAVVLTPLGTYASGVYGKSAAEITAFDPATDRLFVVNALAGAVDVLDASDPAHPVKVRTLSVAGLVDSEGTALPAGVSVNSVDVEDGLLAVAVQAPVKTDLGWLALLRTSDLSPVGAVRVGALPDMVTFAGSGTVVVANEAEPADDFSTDPEGSVSVVDVTGPLSPQSVRTARFTAYDEGRALPQGVRVFGPDVAVPAGQPAAGRVARNLEPEYVAVDQQGETAWVTLQEANAVAVLDLATATFTSVRALPGKDWSAPGNVLDASDRDSAINLRSWPVTGLLMPDAIASYQVRGRTYLVTANEGDAREWGSYAEPLRVGSATLCAAEFPDATALKAAGALGRLNVSRASGFDATRGCYSALSAFGGRSFSVLDEDGTQVFESGAVIEQTLARLVAEGVLPRDAFNATHDTNPSFDTRSDDKGAEPEGVSVGKVRGVTYAFVGLERVGGVMVFDISEPTAPTFVSYANNRDFSVGYGSTGAGAAAAGDLGAEGVEFISADDSPTGQPLVAVANEVSGTTTLFAVG